MTHTARELISFIIAAVLLLGLTLVLSTPLWLGATAALLGYFGTRLTLPIGAERIQTRREEHLALCQERLHAFRIHAEAMLDSPSKLAATQLATTLAECLSLGQADTGHPQPLPELPERLEHLSRLVEKYNSVAPSLASDQATQHSALDHTCEILRKTNTRYQSRLVPDSHDIDEKVADLAKEARLNEQYLQIERELEEIE